VPRLIPALGLIGAPLIIASATIALFRGNDPVTVLAAIATVPIFVWELSLGVWLVVKGFRPSPHHSWNGSYRLTRSDRPSCHEDRQALPLVLWLFSPHVGLATGGRESDAPAGVSKGIAVSEVTVVIGAGSIGQAIARRVSAGKQVLLADLRQGNAEVAAEVLRNAGFEVSTATVDVSSRESLHTLVETATGLGEVTGVIHAAGVSPSQASPAAILAVDLYGTAVLLEEFGNVIARGGAGVVISSQSGHRLGALTAEQDAALATTPAEELLTLPMLGPDQVTDSLHAYQLAKRGNSLRVMAEAVRWGKRGARVNTISPGIIFTPLATDELTGPRGAGYRRMLELSPVGRGGTPDEVATVAALLMGPDGAFITGSDVLMDGGVTAAYFFGDLGPTVIDR
jgi:NAD(P)-dependent dehydrogenase (short-subunit alcohol dehydrogenase family)